MAAVQTRCCCGHSLAAQKDGAGPCEGVYVLGTSVRHRGQTELCSCEAVADTHTVHAVAP